MRGAFVIVAVLGLGLSRSFAGEEAAFDGCYARWDDSRLIAGNSHFERRWRFEGDSLVAESFVLKNPDVEILKAPQHAPSMGFGAPRITASQVPAGPVAAAALQVNIVLAGPVHRGWTVRIFADAGGAVVSQLSHEENRHGDAGPSADSAGGPSESIGPDDLELAARHVRVTAVELVDQSDNHDELAFERPVLLSDKEASFGHAGVLLFAEDALTGTGVAWTKFAPLPHARPAPVREDFLVDAHRRRISVPPDMYPVAVAAYRDGARGRIAALHRLQRCIRAYVADRDGMLMSSTWGDRSKDSRISEDFIFREISAGARLGIDVLAIDDGWQKGRTRNSASTRGAWNGFWAADSDFWTPDPKRFPNGLEPVVKAAHDRGMGIGLWFAPDSSNSAVNWRRDAGVMLDFYHRFGMKTMKVDALKITSSLSQANQRAFFDMLLAETGGRMTIDLDVTAEARPGYFGRPDVGPVFVENRYTDFGTYWPHRTLRNLWSLARYVDPVRLRMEFLNNRRNADNYGADPLAPARYRADTLFAIVMVASPLGWFENTGLSDAFVAQAAPLVAQWRKERARLHGGETIPIGDKPDGVAWTGFVTRAPDHGGYAILFRELNESACHSLDLREHGLAGCKPTVIGGRGTASIHGGRLWVEIPGRLDFVWIRLDPEASE